MAYTGIFIRDQLGQQPNQPSAGWSDSPDTILYGKSPTSDFSQFTSAVGYEKSFPATVYLNQNNYVYLRGLNTNTVEQISHMFFYYTESDLMLWPKNWKSDHITVDGVAQNWSLLDAKAQNDVAVTTSPFVWVPPSLHGNQWDHYCVISWSDNNPTTPTPPDLASLSEFSSVEELAAFVQSHQNVGWRNTSDVYGTPSQYTYQTGLSFESGGGNINLAVTFVDIPDDGTFSVNLQGSDPSNTIATSGLKISDYKGGFNVQGLIYPPNFATSVEVQWFKGATNPSPAAQVKVSITQLASPLVLDMILKNHVRLEDIPVHFFMPTYALPSMDPDQSYFTPTPVILVGRQTLNIRYGENAPT